MRLTPSEVSTLISLSGIRLQSNIRRGRVGTICPFHNDKDFGNAFINVETGAFKCYRCGESGDAIDVYQQLTGQSFTQTLKAIGKEAEHYTSRVDRAMRKQVVVNHEDAVKALSEPHTWPETADFNPDDYLYCRERRITKEWVEHFNIKIGTSGRYKDYMIIPVECGGLRTFEARRIAYYETLQEFLQTDGTLSELKEVFNEIKIELQITKTPPAGYEGFSKWFYRDVGPVKDHNLLYLLSPKNLYPSGGAINATLFNYDNLDDGDVYLREGITGTPRVMKLFGYNHVSATFGTNLSQERIDLLNSIKGRKIFILDNDNAALEALDKLYYESNLENIYVISINSDDTDENFEKDILSAKIISPEKLFSEILFTTLRKPAYLKNRVDKFLENNRR